MQLRGMPGLGRALLVPAAGLLVAVVGAAVAWPVLGLSRPLAVGVVSAALFGVFELSRRLVALDRERRRADAWLRSATGHFIPEVYAWRAAELVSPRERRMLARTLRMVAQLAVERPRARIQFRPHLSAARHLQVSLEALAKRLEREGEPVTPAGMLRIVDLVTDGTGPLWGSSDDALSSEIETTLSVLRAA